MHKKPAISIILPTKNRSKMLTRAIESVRDQDFQGWELIVIDDASTDDTRSVLEELQKRDPRLRVIRHEKSFYPDISRILNEGLREARGKYIARLDDDDWWRDKDKLKIQVEFLEANKDYMAVGGGVVVVDQAGRELYRYLKQEKDEEIRRRALFANPFSHTTAMFRREAALKVGGYGAWRYAEDWDLWLKLGEIGKLYNFPRYFTTYIWSGGNKSFVHQNLQSKMILEIIKSHRKTYPRFFAAYALNLSQYVYSFLPLALRLWLQPRLAYIKRKFF